MKFNLLVIKTANPERLKSQYETLGLEFMKHKHGNGPIHYSSEIGNVVFEIYPLPKGQPIADHTTRLGFTIENLDTLVSILSTSDWIIHSHPTQTDWGYVAVVEDLDGRKVELTGL